MKVCCFLFMTHEAVKLFSRPRLNFSHLNKHKVRHNFKKFVSPRCDCGLDIEPTQHFFLSYYFDHVERL